MSGGSKGQSTNTIQQSDPWVGQQPYLRDIFGQAQKNYQSAQPQFFPGPTVAPQTAPQIGAQNYALNQASTTLPQLGNAATSSAAFNLGPARDVNTNPYLQGAIEAAFRPTINAFTDPGGPLSQARTEFISSGGYGGSRHGLAEGILQSRLGGTLGGMASNMASRGYETGLDASLRQTALMPQTQGAALAPAATMEAVGGQQQAFQQQLINELMQRWEFEQNLPANKLTAYSNLVRGGTGGGTTTTTAPLATANPWLATLGGGAAGAATGGAIGGAIGGGQAGSMAGSYGTAIGAVLGALAGYLGSR